MSPALPAGSAAPTPSKTAARNWSLSQLEARLLLPVVLAAIANVMLVASIDRSQPWSIASAALGMGLFGAVICRQLGLILRLEMQLAGKNRQLGLVSEIFSALNAGQNVGASLSEAFDKLAPALEVDAAAIWLPSPEDDKKLILVERHGLQDEPAEALRIEIEAMFSDPNVRWAEHASKVLGVTAPALTVRLGRGDEDFGFLSVIRRDESLSEVDRVMLQAMGATVGAGLRSVRTIREVRKLADRDPVTGLQNHRSVHQRLANEIDRATREQRPVSLLMMDLDNFKLFNDTYGHPAGDEVLKRVSGVLRRTCREEDIVARYGGDEFLIVLPNMDSREAMKCADRLQAAMAKEKFHCEDSARLPLALSFGVASFPEDARDGQELVLMADTHLYRSKSQGGNRITNRNTPLADSVVPAAEKYDLFASMVQAVDNKDGYTRHHSDEVTEYSLALARQLELADDLVQAIRLAGPLHDVGKIGVPDFILRKPGRLSDEEFAVMKQHPVFGSLLVSALPGMEVAVLGVRHHHERFDGRGYPDRLSGEQIPLIGRIMAIADAYSAMTTSRPYRKSLSEREALNEIRRNLGTQFDPELGQLFVRMREEELTLRENGAKPKRRAPSRRTASTVSV